MAHVPNIVIFDIGGVLAEISKASMRNWLISRRVPENEFFDGDFAALQTGHHDAKTFFDKKSRMFNISPTECAAEFRRMIDATTAKAILPSITMPYLLFSNINEIHFAMFCKEASLSPFAMRHSLLSYQVGYQKPHSHFFSLLARVVRGLGSSALYVDDKEENLQHAERIGLRTAHCRTPAKLLDVLTKNQII